MKWKDPRSQDLTSIGNPVLPPQRLQNTFTLNNLGITSRLDYCNATVYGITEAQHQQLQKMFNIAARILILTPPSDDIETVLLEKLPWQPVSKRIQYKILLLTFKVLHGLALRYLSELLELHVTEWNTRQTDTNRLHKPVMKTRTFGDSICCSSTNHVVQPTSKDEAC